MQCDKCGCWSRSLTPKRPFSEIAKDLAASIIADLIGALIVMVLWNWIFATINPLAEISYWKSLGLMAIVRCCQRPTSKGK